MRTIERLNLRLLIDGEHDGVVRRIHIQTDDVDDFFREVWIIGYLEVLDAVGLEVGGFLNPADLPVAHPGSFGHEAHAPVGGFMRDAADG